MLTILESCLHTYYIDMFDIKLLSVTEMYHNYKLWHVMANKQLFPRQPQTLTTLNFSSGLRYTCLQIWNPVYTAIILLSLISEHVDN